MLKKTFKLAALLVAALAIGLVTNQKSWARLTNPSATDADIWCVGPEGAEICVDASGNLLPTTASDTTLGTASLPFATVYADDITLGDDATVNDDLTVNGDTTLGNSNADLVISSGPVSINGGTPSGGTLVVQSTSATAGNPILSLRDNTGTEVVMVSNAGGLAPRSRTVAQLQALAPSRVGLVFFCSDCANTLGSTGELVVSTGTSAGNFASAGGDIFK